MVKIFTTPTLIVITNALASFVSFTEVQLALVLQMAECVLRIFITKVKRFASVVESAFGDTLLPVAFEDLRISQWSVKSAKPLGVLIDNLVV